MLFLLTKTNIILFSSMDLMNFYVEEAARLTGIADFRQAIQIKNVNFKEKKLLIHIEFFS